MVWVLPRSTCSHCGSLKALDQRVPVLPSTALPAAVPAFSCDEAVAGRPCARFVVPQPPPLDWTVQVNVAVPVAPVVSRAVTVTVDVPAAVGAPVIRPVPELMVRPAGRPVALYVSVWPDAESVACTWTLTPVPTVDDWLPGEVTVTVLPPPEPVGMVQICWAEPVHVSMSSRAPVLAPGTVRHSPEFGFTSSPLAW